MSDAAGGAASTDGLPRPFVQTVSSLGEAYVHLDCVAEALGQIEGPEHQG